MTSGDQPPGPPAFFVCPLCSEESGRRIVIFVEYDLTTPFVSVGDLVGCPHARRFGQLGGLTLDEERRLIEAALELWEAMLREAGEGQGEDRPEIGCA